jgi:hypothetical protein
MRIVGIGAIFDLQLVGSDDDAHKMSVNQGSSFCSSLRK